MQLVHRGGDQTRATGAQRVAQGDCTAVGIDARVVILKPKLAQDCQALCGKGFVEFNHIHLRQGQTGQRQHFL